MSHPPASPPPRRHPNGGGYARGEQTRARIIEAALRVFGEQGYAHASTRAIASEAGVMPPALQYYFDGKDGLHRACGDYLANRMSETLSEPMAHARAALAQGDGKTAALALCDLLEQMLALSTRGDTGPTVPRQFMARARLESDKPAFPVLRDKVLTPFHQLCIALTTMALGKQEEDDESRLTAIMLMSQIFAFGPNRAINLTLLGWQDFRDERFGHIRAVLRGMILRSLGFSADAA